jgi:hypothetical protein
MPMLCATLAVPLAVIASAHGDRPSTVPVARFEPVSVPGTTALAASPANFDPSEYGYTEKEYYVSGTANRYIFPDVLKDAQLLDGGYPYKTRMIVRRPKNSGKFNGTVVVEWFNVTLGQDIDFNWATSREYLMRNGYAYVSISAQRVGVEDMKAWSPARYGSLNVTAPPTTPPDPIGQNDALSWDIFSQTVKGLRNPRGVDPLSGLRVKSVIATGESQGGRRLTQYYNSIDPLHRLVDGMVFYDPGYNTPHILRGDNPTKLVSVGSEVHSDGRPGGPVADGKYTRRWEVAGTSHLSHWDMLYVDAHTSRDMSLTGAGGVPAATAQDVIPGCTYYPLWSAVPFHKVLNSAFDHVNDWVQRGKPAPTGKPLDREPGSLLLRHTADGRTFGGVQLAEYVYPTAFNLGYLNPGPGFCRNGGHHRFYDEAELEDLYPNPGAYVRGVVETTKKNLAAGYILCEDAQETVEAAYRLFDRRPRLQTVKNGGRHDIPRLCSGRGVK